jgi:hypothetical protein
MPRRTGRQRHDFLMTGAIFGVGFPVTQEFH